MPHARMPAKRGLSFSFLAKNPAAAPRRANPPTMKGISTEKLMYNPPMAPVKRPAHGPAMMPLMSMGIWVKWMLELKDPMAIGMVKGVIDKMFDRAAIMATNVRVFVLFMVEQRSSNTFFQNSNTHIEHLPHIQRLRFFVFPIAWLAQDFNLT